MGKKKKITQTVAEFRAWIEGIEEMQEASWHPSAAQWKKIRTRIDTIQEEAVGLMTGLHSSTNLHVPMAPSAPSRLDIVEIVEPSTSALVNHKAPPATTTDARLPAPKTEPPAPPKTSVLPFTIVVKLVALVVPPVPPAIVPPVVNVGNVT